ncbi:MAG: bifunctional diaminohydroxyphosphoribosylaminopyrimidine deaminase/5-amino-6-(5-phosphoribosylamino)uracil reductase RibD [Firmicutes bacterium]|nr:bifunctional diaminohydroxyphosphoribosylaminopyrimidine deaminase/5-amino-6-(5-phosphoribosylamino)uracil reductase RibD [Bacillota bacterium]
MKRALALAARAAGRTSPNPMVGAVVVRGGRIVGEGYHQKAGTPHAEVHAMRRAGDKARGATLYVTLEPCSHYGRTPPCCEAVIDAGIKRVVAAMVDPNPQVAGRGLAALAEAGIAVEAGLMEDAARDLNEVFIKHITTGRPFVVMKSAVSLDGKTATSSGHSFWVTGEAAREKVHRMRDRYDAVMVGIGTVLVDDPRLTTRLPDGEAGRDAIRVVVDSRLRLPPESKVINPDSTAPLLVATTERSPRERRDELTGLGAEVLVLPEDDGRVAIGALMDALGQRGITSVLLEGGAALNASALEAGVVDKLVVFVAPKLVGGANAPGMIAGAGRERMDQAWDLRRMSLTRVGEDYMFTGYL